MRPASRAGGIAAAGERRFGGSGTKPGGVFGGSLIAEDHMSKDASSTNIDAAASRAGADAPEGDAPELPPPARHAGERLDVAPGRPEHRILRVELAGDGNRRAAPIERDVAQAVQDLQADGFLHPRGLIGPFDLRMQIERGRLLFEIRDAHAAPLAIVGLALGPFRRLIKDYLLLVESHSSALTDGRLYRAEAIDMGRRTLHNEGAELIIARLENKVGVGFETARRLFTLVCVLHQRF